jgi:hypothetical protein
MWEKVETDTLFCLMMDNQFLIEGPEDDLDYGDDEYFESIMRVFLTYEEACIYCEQIQGYNPESVIKIVEMTILKLYELLDEIEISAVHEYGCPARIDVSTIEPDSYASSIDTLWSAFESTPDNYN